MKGISQILLVISCGLALTAAQNCQECQAANDVYCHNQTSYQNCMSKLWITPRTLNEPLFPSGGAPFGDVQHCPSGTVCTNSDDPCKVITTTNPDIRDVCGSTGGNGAGCQVCDGTSKYTCVSSTKFARCSGTTLIDSIIYDCKNDEVCNIEALASHQTVCVPTCALEFLDMKATCSNVEFATTTTTAAPTTTPDPQVRRTKCSNAATASGTTAKFFYTRYTDDATCRSYLYCELVGSDYTTVFLSCNSPRIYFDSIAGECVKTKPTDCT
ncbi:hypothetical protein KR054_003521 [Drosophila jambulina]|nr:hypothetical protein KR054_003521 [Drosophila jambulina]